jgi:hypothetical protein
MQQWAENNTGWLVMYPSKPAAGRRDATYDHAEPRGTPGHPDPPAGPLSHPNPKIKIHNAASQAPTASHYSR